MRAELLEAGLASNPSDRLPQVHRRSVQAVLANPKETANGSAADLATRADVSAATVSRFARYLGFASYAGLQRSMTRAVELGIHEHGEIHAGVGFDDDVATVIAKVTEYVRAG